MYIVFVTRNRCSGSKLAITSDELVEAKIRLMFVADSGSNAFMDN